MVPPAPICSKPFSTLLQVVASWCHMAKGVSVSANPKVMDSSSVAEGDSSKDLRDESEDDTFMIIKGIKVQVTEGSVLYAQCKSWLNNGFTEENQPQCGDHVKSLPKPSPASIIDLTEEDNNEKQEKGKEDDVEHLSAKELLHEHIKNGKKVRARLRDHGLDRTERNKRRLALLLPPLPPIPEQPKTDASASRSQEE